MGIGIWAMRFNGMLAFHLPAPVEYHWLKVLASLLGAAVALYVASRQKMDSHCSLDWQHIYGRRTSRERRKAV